MGETSRELFLLFSVLALISAIFIFSALFAPNLFSISGPDTENKAQSPENHSFNATSQLSKNIPDNGLLAQSINGLKQLYRDAVGGLSLIFNPG